MSKTIQMGWAQFMEKMNFIWAISEMVPWNAMGE
jgi:hypothetical protein